MTPWSGDRTRIWYSGTSGLGGNGNGGCVTTGSFRAGVWTKTNGQCLTRGFNGRLPELRCRTLSFHSFC